MRPIGPIGTSAGRVAASTLGIVPADVGPTTPGATNRNQQHERAPRRRRILGRPDRGRPRDGPRPGPMGGRRSGGRRRPRLRCGPGPRSRRGSASSDRARAERARGARRQVRLAPAGRAVHQRDDPGPARRRRDHRGHRRPQGHRHHPGHRRAQRDHRVRPGIPGGTGDGRAEAHDQPVGARRSRRRHDRRPGGRARAGRPRAARRGGRRDRRHAPGRGSIPPDQRGRPDRRIGTRQQDHGSDLRCHRRGPRRPAEHGLQWHRGDLWAWPGPGRGDRDGDGPRTGRRTPRGTRQWPDTAPATAVDARQATGGRGVPGVHLRVRQRRRPWRAGRCDVPDGGEPRGRGHPGRPAGRRDDRPGSGRPTDGPTTRARSQAAGRRDPRVGHRDLQRQDRHPDREPDARRAGLDPERRLSRDRRWLRADRTVRSPAGERHRPGATRPGRRRLQRCVAPCPGDQR